MAYKYSTGSVRRGDIYFEDDRAGDATYIDFGQDTITLRPSGSQILYAEATKVGINTTAPDYTLDVAGDVGVNEYIYHNGDTDTYIRFQGDEMNLFAGGKSMIKLDEATNDKVIINNAGTDIDFRVNGENVDDLLMTDAANDLISVAGNIHTTVHDYGTGADINVDFNKAGLQKALLNADVAIDTAAANKGAGKSIVIKILCDGTARTFTWNSSWVFIGEKPASIAASKTAILSMTCFGTAEADIVCSYAVQD